jgi:hypothetical protein
VVVGVTVDPVYVAVIVGFTVSAAGESVIVLVSVALAPATPSPASHGNDEVTDTVHVVDANV